MRLGSAEGDKLRSLLMQYCSRLGKQFHTVEMTPKVALPSRPQTAK